MFWWGCFLSTALLVDVALHVAHGAVVDCVAEVPRQFRLESKFPAQRADIAFAARALCPTLLLVGFAPTLAVGLWVSDDDFLAQATCAEVCKGAQVFSEGVLILLDERSGEDVAHFILRGLGCAILFCNLLLLLGLHLSAECGKGLGHFIGHELAS